MPRQAKLATGIPLHETVNAAKVASLVVLVSHRPVLLHVKSQGVLILRMKENSINLGRWSFNHRHLRVEGAVVVTIVVAVGGEILLEVNHASLTQCLVVVDLVPIAASFMRLPILLLAG